LKITRIKVVPEDELARLAEEAGPSSTAAAMLRELKNSRSKDRQFFAFIDLYLTRKPKRSFSLLLSSKILLLDLGATGTNTPREIPMPNKAVSKVERGIKRVCQNVECGARFYDLLREPIICPICNTVYAPPPPAAVPTARTYLRPVKKIVVPEIKPENAQESDDLPVIEGDEEPASDSDETLIEEVDEDTPDVAGTVDAPIEPDEKT